jgi:hypothetical protein
MATHGARDVPRARDVRWRSCVAVAPVVLDLIEPNVRVAS